MQDYIPCIGGLPGVVFDRGMVDMARELNRIEGVEAQYFPWFRWKEGRRKAIELHRAGRLRHLMIVGHSYGGLKAKQIAEDVAKVGMSVRYIAALDTTAGYQQAIPANVEYVEEYWARFGVPAWARLRKPDGSNGGKYLYPHDTPHLIRKFTCGHIALGSKQEVRALVAAKVSEIAG